MFFEQKTKMLKALQPLGAFKTITLEYVFPSIANKNDAYTCPGCKEPVYLCQGNVRAHHFRHKTKINHCLYFCSPSENEIRQDFKMRSKVRLELKLKTIAPVNKKVQPRETISLFLLEQNQDEYHVPPKETNLGLLLEPANLEYRLPARETISLFLLEDTFGI